MLWNNEEVGIITGSPERKDLYNQALSCLDREENLIHYRMSWGLQWNAGSFGALFAVQALTLDERAKALIDIAISFFAIGVCLIAYTAVAAAHVQSWFVIRTLCQGLGVAADDWQCEFIRPYGKPKTVHFPARRISKYLFWGIIALWATVIITLFQQGLTKSIHLYGNVSAVNSATTVTPSNSQERL